MVSATKIGALLVAVAVICACVEAGTLAKSKAQRAAKRGQSKALAAKAHSLKSVRQSDGTATTEGGGIADYPGMFGMGGGAGSEDYGTGDDGAGMGDGGSGTGGDGATESAAAPATAAPATDAPATTTASSSDDEDGGFFSFIFYPFDVTYDFFNGIYNSVVDGVLSFIGF